MLPEIWSKRQAGAMRPACKAGWRWAESGAPAAKKRGWARLLLGRARDLNNHGPAQRGANGTAMPTDEDDQDGHFFFNHPERGGNCAA